MRNILVLLMVCLVCGCAVKPKTTVTPPPVEVPTETALSKAAEEIQRDLLMLMGDRYADIEPSAVAALTATTSYRFTGELEDLVKDVAKRIGYKADFTGRIPSQAIVVTIYSLQPISWFHILQSAGTQAGNRADLIVNARDKTLTVAYDGIDGQKVPKVAKGDRMQKPSRRNLLQYRGDVAGAHKQIASKFGYKTKVVGSPVKVPVNIASGTRSWNEIIDLLNVKMKDAKFIVDDATETVILRYGN